MVCGGRGSMEDDTMGTEDDYKQAKAIYDQEIKDSASFTLNEKESIQAEVDRLGEKSSLGTNGAHGREGMQRF